MRRLIGGSPAQVNSTSAGASAAVSEQAFKLGLIGLRNPVEPVPNPIKLATEKGKLFPSTKALMTYAKGLDKAARRLRYPSLSPFSKQIGLSEDILIASFELEHIFHQRILAEPSATKRQKLNHELYTKVFEIYGSVFNIDLDAKSSPKDAIVQTFASELAGRSILDIGCGSGSFLLSCARNIPHKELYGIDVFVEDLTIKKHNLCFRKGDVVNFKVDRKFQVAITDNVYEHIAPQDVKQHLASVHNALQPGGTFIVLTPHTYFGPWDVTRILDNSYSGWTLARGTHINETTYRDLASQLQEAGFKDLKTIHPKKRVLGTAGSKRIDIDLMCRGEARPGLVRRLQAFDKSRSYSAFEICMIAKKA